jgi:ABC-type branched-subunit amino acid transport system substrate-binding protein
LRFSPALRQLGVNIVWLGSPSITTTTARKLAGATLYGAYTVADFHPDANPEAKAFSEKYLASYKTTPNFFASWPYDAVHVLAQAITTAGSTDPQKIRDGHPQGNRVKDFTRRLDWRDIRRPILRFCAGGGWNPCPGPFG